MTRATAIDWHTIQNALLLWVCQITGIQWMWADQDTSQLLYPYGVLSLVSGFQKLAMDEIRQVPGPEGEDTKVFQAHTGPRSFTIGFQVSVGTPNSDERPDESAESVLSSILGSTQFQASQDIFRSANIAIENENPILPLNLQVGSQRVSRASLDIVFRTQSYIEEAVDQIDEIEISSEVLPGQISSTDTIDLTGV